MNQPTCTRSSYCDRIYCDCVQDKLESVLDVSHQQMEQYRDQPAHAEKIAYQQKLLQEDVVHIRAEISQISTVRRGSPTMHSILFQQCSAHTVIPFETHAKADIVISNLRIIVMFQIISF